MNKLLNSCLFILLVTSNVIGQKPTWTINPSAFQYQSSHTAVVEVDFHIENGLNNLLGAFKNEEVRGVATPLSIGNNTFFFLQLYANSITDSLELRFYLAESDTVLILSEPILFQEAEVLGSIENPIVYSFINNYNYPPRWRVDSHTISVETGTEIPSLTISDWVEDRENNQLSFFAEGNNQIVMTREGDSLLTFTYPFGYIGTEHLLITAYEVENPDNKASISITLTITPIDIEPVIISMPDVFTLFKGEKYNTIDLNQFFRSPDGNQLLYSIEIPLSEQSDEKPVWQVNPSDYELTMNLTAEVSLYGIPTVGDNQLGVFVENELRGVGIPQWITNKWVYFITLYANEPGENVTFKFWHNPSQRLFNGYTELLFDSQNSVGSIESPFVIEFGGIKASISDNVLLIDPRETFSGKDSLTIVATEMNTEKEFSTQTNFHFHIIDIERPRFKPVASQTIVDSITFYPIDLDSVIVFSEPIPVSFEIERIEDSEELFTAQIDALHVLTVTSLNQDSYGSNRFNVKVSRTDFKAAADSMIIEFVRKASYLPPKPFNLVFPQHEQQLDTTRFEFIWDSSTVFEGKSAVYTLRIQPLNGGGAIVIRGLTETTYKLDGTEGIANNQAYEWYVTVSDGETTVESTERRTFTIGTVVALEDGVVELPQQTQLLPNYPNPFNPSTTIRYQLASNEHVKINVVDIQGRLVATLIDKFQSSGEYATIFNASSLSSGVYFVRFYTSKEVFTQKIMLLK